MDIILVDEDKMAVDALVSVLEPVLAETGQRARNIQRVYSPEEALELVKTHNYDIAFLDIEMPGMNGIELAHHIKKEKPDTNIVFVTGYPSYSLEAHGLYPSGFLVKPVSEDDVRGALENLRRPIERKTTKRMRMDCFGNFEVFVDGKPLKLSRTKSKELLAYLVDREGAMCTVAEISLALWEDDSPTKLTQVRNLISDLRNSLREVGLEGALVRTRGALAVDTDAFDCDYYDFLRADPVAVKRYRGEFMEQYSWAMFTSSRLANEMGW